MNNNKPKIVVLGAGYAGLMTAKRLTKILDPEEADLVLVNKHNYHYETTWLHEVAGGTISPNQARFMISDAVSPNRVQLFYDEVVEIKRDEQKVMLQDGEITYDYLVVALGFVTNTFGIKGMDEHAFFIQDINTSQLIRDHIEYQFSAYANGENDDEEALTI